MAAKSLRYLTVIPRSLGNSSRFLPSAPGCYLADNAMTELLHLASTSGTLDLFLKHDVNTNISAPIETYIDHCHATKKRYNKLVRLGHIAALRMYDEQQLLSSSYFHSDNDSVWVEFTFGIYWWKNRPLPIRCCQRYSRGNWSSETRWIPDSVFMA